MLIPDPHRDENDAPGLAIWFALILYLSMLGASTLEGCNAVGNHIVCAPGTLIFVYPV